jgi:predicted nucleotide-binding protein
MWDIKQKLGELVKEGKNFTFQNFCEHDPSGKYAESYKPEYVSWKVRVETLLRKQFTSESPVFREYLSGQEEHVLGYGEPYFRASHNFFLGALKAAEDLIDFNVEDKEAITGSLSNKVFVVHGHDEKLKEELAAFLATLGLEPIVLHKQPDMGQTIIEKFESNSDVGYAIILLTPDDIGYSSTEESKGESENKRFRARQNVIFEFGYFVGRLGRNRVCCVYKGDVELPTDVSGIIYKKIGDKFEEVAFSIIKDLKAVGYTLPNL